MVPTVAYFNDFESAIGSAWASSASLNIATTPIGSRNFLGEFSNDTANLSLTGLPAHNQVTVLFDVFVLRSWDGNSSATGGPYGTLGQDVFDVSVDGGPTLLHTTFSNHFDSSISSTSTRQAYPQAFGDGNFAAGTGASEINTLGYAHPVLTTTPMDSVYHITLRFDHLDSAVTIQFAAAGLQAIGDESWGLDNVQVDVSNLPRNYVPDYTNSLVQPGPGNSPSGTVTCATCGSPVRAADGAATPTNTSTAFGSGGFGHWLGQLLTYTNGTGYTSDTANGSGNRDIMMPSLLQGDGGTIVATIGGADAIYFDFNGSTYTPRFFGTEALTYDSGTGLYTLGDSSGNQFVFHDFASGLPAGQRGQLQSIVDPAGNATEVVSRNADGPRRSGARKRLAVRSRPNRFSTVM
ncbi:MAG: hypothetical protein K2R98_22595 [Gemmataceae bacterium]|nr:hypothetical protein [Gemmataceae bacterium]